MHLPRALFTALTLTASALAASALAAYTPAQILSGYHEKAAAALTKVNETLEKATVPLVADLVKAGDTTGAELLKEQLKAKKDGTPVPAPQGNAIALFKSYDAARAKALEPAQKAAIARINTALASSDGKKLEVVSALGLVRAEIESGKVEPTAQVPPEAAKAVASKGFLRQNKIPKKWGYFLSQTYEKRYGTLYLNEDGTLIIDAASPGTGTWAPTADSTILSFDIQNEAKTPEKTELIIKGGEATLKRVSGMRYLKAD